LREKPDEPICPEMPISLRAIGLCYRDFHQMSDDEVTNLLGVRCAQSSAIEPGG
jgi:predicted phosphoribosyltransferase